MEKADGILHSLKSVSGNISATAVYRNGIDLRDAIIRKDTLKIEELLQTFENSVMELCYLIEKAERLEPIDDDKKEVKLDVNYIKSCLHLMLISLTENIDISVAVDTVNELYEHTKKSEYSDLISSIKSPIEMFNISLAVSRINEAIQKIK